MLKSKKTYLIPILGFLLIIILGTILLSLPICNNKPISFIDAFYTATSGVTTTGFTKGALVDQFNFFGQFVLSILMEVGAMGFIIFVSYFWSIKHKKIKMSDIMVINDNISSESYNLIKEESIFIGKLMLEVQILGVVLLAFKFVPLLGFFKGIWYSIFHTISAFSNTGFDLCGSSSLTSFSKDIYIQIILICLMVLGSIGVFAIEDIKNNRNKKFNRLRLQTKIIIIYTLILLIFPSILLKIFNSNISLLNGLFMSASSRSTGFSIVDLNSFTSESKILLIILMFIGGSPASTSGGIKVVTLAIIITTVISTLRARENTVMFSKTIPNSIVRKSFTVFMMFIIVLFITSMIFYHFNNNINMLNIVFESVSAITNTGLTITSISDINLIGTVILMLLMFIGRIGPLSMVLVFINENRKDKYIEYPNENVIL